MPEMSENARDKDRVLPDHKAQRQTRERELPRMEDQEEASPVLPRVQKIVVEYMV